MLVVSQKRCVKANWRPFLLLLAGLLRHESSVTALLVNLTLFFIFFSIFSFLFFFLSLSLSLNVSLSLVTDLYDLFN